MKLSLKWLSEHVDLRGIDPADVAARLTRSTCEVEGVHETFAHLGDVVVARILAREAHPNADRLSLCTVDTGKEELRIVCGAPNAAENLVVPLAGVGVRLPTADGFLEIREAKIRGVESRGMLCAASELGLADFVGESSGLLVLNTEGADAPRLGTSLAELFPLHDFVFEIDNKSITHRPDLWSHYGFARELALLFDRKLGPDPLGGSTAPKRPASKKTKKAQATGGPGARKIRIEKGAAKAYFGLACEGVRVAASPLWMRARLFTVGQRPINNLVDASNYLMLESGQPNHVFDARTLRGDTVQVRRTTEGRVFTTLDGVERELPSGTVLIEDVGPEGARAVAMGGIMGGLDSAVMDDTSAVFLESASFHREDIRRTLGRTALRTDSAVRFEKGQDPSRARPALLRLVELLRLTCPGLRVGAITGEMPEGPKENRIRLSVDFVNARLGLALKPAQVKRTLERLGFRTASAKGPGGPLVVTAPSYRSQYDVVIPEDVVEEIGRIVGYDNIEPTSPLLAARPVPVNTVRSLERRVKTFLAAGGYFETNNYSFARVEDNRRFGEAGIRLRNPSFQDRDRLRVSLIPGILRQAAANQDRFGDVRLFELGRGYLPRAGAETPVTEQRSVALLHVPDGAESAAHPGPWEATDSYVYTHFLQSRDLLSALLSELMGDGASRMESVASGPEAAPFHPGCRVQWTVGDRIVARAGVLHPAWQVDFDLKRPAVLALIDMDALHAGTLARHDRYTPPSPFPESFFEVSVLLDENASTAEPPRIIAALAEDRIRQVQLLALFRGEQLPAGKKSASYRIACGRPEGTLSGEEVQELMTRTVAALTAAGMPLR